LGVPWRVVVMVPLLCGGLMRKSENAQYVHL
jgi:hypothetical protein